MFVVCVFFVFASVLYGKSAFGLVQTPNFS